MYRMLHNLFWNQQEQEEEMKEKIVAIKAFGSLSLNNHSLHRLYNSSFSSLTHGDKS